MIQAPTTSSPNRLYYGDCLGVMERLNTESIDLIYLDPPFNSNRDYNSIYKDETGRPLPDQIQAFTDTWTFSSKTFTKEWPRHIMSGKRQLILE